MPSSTSWSRATIEWLKNVNKMIDGDDHDMPEQGKYNGGQKLLFWGLVIGMAAITVSGVFMWRAWWTPAGGHGARRLGGACHRCRV